MIKFLKSVINGELFTTFSSGRQKVFELCISQQFSIGSSFLSAPDCQCLFLGGSINCWTINERGYSIELLPPILDYFSKIKCVNAFVYWPLIKTWPKFLQSFTEKSNGAQIFLFKEVFSFSPNPFATLKHEVSLCEFHLSRS